MMKYISPGSWFSLEYPDNWCEAEEAEDSFLFTIPKSGTETSASRLIRARTVTMPKTAWQTNCAIRPVPNP